MGKNRLLDVNEKIIHCMAKKKKSFFWILGFLSPISLESRGENRERSALDL